MEPFLVLEFKVDPVEPGRDILLACLDEMEYDSFEETAEGLKAYILEGDFKEAELKSHWLLNSKDFTISYDLDKLENKNWNEEWETNYKPIDIEGQVYIRAPFHEPSQAKMELVIEPKMSFGTGHHQTTRLMVKLMLSQDFKSKKVLDMGTGTGVLAIVAEKLGADYVMAIDNFEWAVENTAENAERNSCTNIECLHGDADALKEDNYDIILANINRNVLLDDMHVYVKSMAVNSYILFSGFFEQDFGMIQDEAKSLGLELQDYLQEDRWISARFKRS